MFWKKEREKPASTDIFGWGGGGSWEVPASGRGSSCSGRAFQSTTATDGIQERPLETLSHRESWLPALKA